MSDLEQRIEDILEAENLTEYSSVTPLPTEDLRAKMVALCEQYAAAKVGEALGKVKLEKKPVELDHDDYPRMKSLENYGYNRAVGELNNRIDEVAAQYGVNREEK